MDCKDAERAGSVQILFLTPTEKHQGQPAAYSGMCLPFAAAHHLEHLKLFMPELTLGPGSGLHCHADPHRVWECGWECRAGTGCRNRNAFTERRIPASLLGHKCHSVHVFPASWQNGLGVNVCIIHRCISVPVMQLKIKKVFWKLN